MRQESAGSTPNGNFNIGNTNQQTAISPSIIIPTGGITTLTFDAWNDGECNTGTTNCTWDRLWAVVTNGILSTTVARSTTEIPGSSTIIPDAGGSYTPVSVDLTALGFGGSTINLRYNFNSLDFFFNDFPGARIDNIQISTTTAIPEPATLALFGLGLAGLGFARRKKSA